MNKQQTARYDLNGAQGVDFFTPFTPSTPGSNAGAAADMTVALTDPDQVAASGNGTQGDNSNATALANLVNQPIVAGQTAGNYYSNLIDQVGNDVSNASAEQTAVGLVLQQLTNQQSSISGVSLDEEATNLVMYQRAYEASARVISVVDELTKLPLVCLHRAKYGHARQPGYVQRHPEWVAGQFPAGGCGARAGFNWPEVELTFG